MTAEPRRVALMARPGPACERLAEVLAAAGVERVLQADPTQLDVPELLAADPQVVLVALDAATEDVLERFDAVLGDPAIDVIYEEGDLVAARDGWDAARWQRHLVAKLQGHADVLPPGTEEPGIQAPGGSAGAAQAPDIAATVAAQVSAGGYSVFDPVEAESAEAGPDGDVRAGDSRAAIGHQPQETGAPGDPDAAPIPAADDAGAPAGDGAAAGDTLAAELAAALQDTPIESPAPSGFGELRLEGDDDATDGADCERFRSDLADLESRISTLSLVDDTPVRGPEQPRGAVLVMAGIGGPDAVRQLLGALPGDFARPVLVRQRLDGGRYDKLVAQMQRATRLPVKLAEVAQTIAGGVVYIVPPELGLSASDTGMRFCDDGELLARLPPGDSAVLLLSGSDPADVDAVMNHGWSGALVAGQSPDGCYDAAAPTALATRGGDTAKPPELAKRLAQRWPG